MGRRAAAAAAAGLALAAGGLCGRAGASDPRDARYQYQVENLEGPVRVQGSVRGGAGGGSGYYFADPYGPADPYAPAGGAGGGRGSYGMSDFDYSDLYDSDLYEDVYLPVDPYAPATPRDPYATRVVASNTDPYDPYASGGARPGGEPQEITSEHVVDSVQRLQEALVIAAQEGDVGHLRQLINARGDPKDAHTVVMRQFAIGLPLDVAAKMGQLGVVTQIVKFADKSRMLLEGVQEELDRAIYLAARADERRVIRHLLGQGASLHYALEGAGDGGHDGLMEALYGRIRRAESMEALGAQPTEEQLNMLAMTWKLLPTEEELEAQEGKPKARRWYCVWLCKTTQSDKEIARRERRDYKAQTKNDMYVLEKMAAQAVSDGKDVTDVVEPTVTAQSFTFGSTGQLP